VPIIEQTQLFKASIGDFITDIVETEMFSFVDQGEDHINVRPTPPAGIVLALDFQCLCGRTGCGCGAWGPMVQARAAARRDVPPVVPSDRRGGILSLPRFPTIDSK